MRLTVGILYFDSDLEETTACLESLVQQLGLGEIGGEWQIVCLDNGSPTVSLPTDLPQQFPTVIFQRSERNLGFGTGHNHIMREHPADVHAVLNIDAHFAPEFLSLLLEVLDRHPRAGSSIGKLLRWQPDREGEGTAVIDSAGIDVTTSHAFSDLGQGETDTGRFDAAADVFGGSGAAVVYRRTALEDIAYRLDGREEYFDETFFLYKEDVDLAYRLQAAGWSCRYVPQALGWHQRTLSKDTRGRTSPSIRSWSAAHESILLRKHESWWPLTVRLLTWCRQLLKWAYLLSLEPRVFLSAKRLIRTLEPQARLRREQTKHIVPFSFLAHLFR